MSTSWRTSSVWPTGSSTTTRSPTASSGSASSGITLPTFSELADPTTIDPARRRRRRSPGRRRPQPVARPLVQRPRRRARRRARSRRAAVVADRRREPDHRRLRRPLPDDHGPQGARRLRLPGAAGRHRPVRPDPPPGDLAVDRQLRPGRHRHQPDHGQPRRGHPSRGDEPGALRLARPVVRGPGRGRHPHPRHGVQRQGDLRRLQRAGAGPGELRAQPVLRVRQPPRPLRGHRPGARSTCSTPSARAVGHAPRRVRLGHRLGRHDRRRRPAQGALRHAASSPSRRWSARRCWRTASASTTSRASATSTSR